MHSLISRCRMSVRRLGWLIGLVVVVPGAWATPPGDVTDPPSGVSMGLDVLTTDLWRGRIRSSGAHQAALQPWIDVEAPSGPYAALKGSLLMADRPSNLAYDRMDLWLGFAPDLGLISLEIGGMGGLWMGHKPVRLAWDVFVGIGSGTQARPLEAGGRLFVGDPEAQGLQRPGIYGEVWVGGVWELAKTHQLRVRATTGVQGTDSAARFTDIHGVASWGWWTRPGVLVGVEGHAAWSFWQETFVPWAVITAGFRV